MINTLTLLCMIISAVIGLLLPLALALIVTKGFKASWKAVLIGVLVFTVFQPLTRIQLLKYIQSTYWYSYNLIVNPWLIYILLGISAGIFEEVGRFIGFKFFLKDKLQWKNGVAFGIGHGGIEAVLFCGITFLVLIFKYVQGGMVLPGTPLLFLVGGIERIFAMTFHIAASLMVLYAVRNKKISYLFYAILLHGGMDASIGFIKGTFFIELTAALFSIFVMIFIVKKIKSTSEEKILF